MTKKTNPITDHPFQLRFAQPSRKKTEQEDAIIGDEPALADIYYRNLQLAYPAQSDLVESEIDKTRLQGFFKNLIESEDHAVFILSGVRGTPYGFFTIGKPLEKQMQHAGLDYKNRMFLHHLFVNPDYHGRYFGDLLLDGILSVIKNGQIPDIYSPQSSTQNESPALTTIVSQSNERAIKFFEQLGANRANDINITTFAGVKDPSCLMEWRRVTDLAHGLVEMRNYRQNQLESIIANAAPQDIEP